MLAFMSQVGPDDAVSNISKWIAKATPPPEWIKAPALDTIWTVAFAVFAVLVVASYFWPKSKANEPSPLSSPARPSGTKHTRIADDVVETRQIPVIPRDSPFKVTIGGKEPTEADIKQAMKFGIKAAQAGAELKRLHDAAAAELQREESATEPVDRFIAMPKAARRAYEELRSLGSMWTGVADRLAARSSGESHEHAALRYMAGAFLTQNVPIYGAHPPSRKRELIDPRNLKRGGFDQAGAVFSYHMEKDPRYVDLAVRERDLAVAIEKMKGDSRAESAFQKGFHKVRPRSLEDTRVLLAELWEEGVQIRNHPMTVAHMFSPELDDWIDQITLWMEEVIDALEPVDAANAIWFRTLGNVGDPQVPIPNIRLEGKEERARFIKAFCEHDARVLRLKNLLPTYRVGV